MYDYVITGGGPAGCCLAHRLTEDADVRVLLLETGKPDSHPLIHMPAGFAKLTGERAAFGYRTVPQANLDGREVWYPQGRVMGGGSSINAQIFTRGHPLDYDEWANDLGCPGWSFAEILPYFTRFEDNQRFADAFHGSGGPLQVSDPVPHEMTTAYVRAAQQFGIPYNADFNGAEQAGCGYYQLTNRGGRRSSAAGAYIKPILGRPNLTVKTGATVIRLVVENGRATGVQYVEGGGSTPVTAKAEREVLVASGAIGSPKLLLLSGIGPADRLADVGIDVVHELPGVGENLQDHMDIFVVSECRGDFSFDKYKPLHMTLWAGLQYLLFNSGPVASNLCDGGGFWYADEAARSPDLQFHFLPGSGLEHGLTPIRNGVTLNSAFLRPLSRGSVRLKSADPRDHPLIDPNYWGDPYDREMSIRGFRMVREIMRQPAFEPFIKSESMPGSDAVTDDDIAAYARRFSKTDYHPVGTCKMGTDDMAVVDPELRVHGLAGLRVCDSSAMPKLISSNTNAPTMMVAEKASDHIRGLI